MLLAPTAPFTAQRAVPRFLLARKPAARRSARLGAPRAGARAAAAAVNSAVLVPFAESSPPKRAAAAAPPPPPLEAAPLPPRRRRARLVKDFHASGLLGAACLAAAAGGSGTWLLAAAGAALLAGAAASLAARAAGRRFAASLQFFAGPALLVLFEAGVAAAASPAAAVAPRALAAAAAAAAMLYSATSAWAAAFPRGERAPRGTSDAAPPQPPPPAEIYIGSFAADGAEAAAAAHGVNVAAEELGWESEDFDADGAPPPPLRNAFDVLGAVGDSVQKRAGARVRTEALSSSPLAFVNSLIVLTGAIVYEQGVWNAWDVTFAGFEWSEAAAIGVGLTILISVRIFKIPTYRPVEIE